MVGINHNGNYFNLFKLYKMKQFLLFSGNFFENTGGFHNFKGDYITIEEAKKAINEIPHGFIKGKSEWYDWMHIVDIQTMQIVYSEIKD